MDAFRGWLLPILLICTISLPMLRWQQRPREERFLNQFTGGVLLLLTLGLLWQSNCSWYGPTLFQLDSFHEIRIQFGCSLFGMAMLWVCWWFLRSPQNTNSTALHLLPICLLFLMILSRDLWLSCAALIAFSLVQESLIERRRLQSHRDRALRGCHWWGVFLLVVSLAILSFDFQFSTYSHLAEEIRVWDQFSDAQQADLRLAALLASWGLLMIVGVFPISALWVDRESTSSTELLGMIAAVVMTFHLLPLLTVTQVTAVYGMLFVCTVASASLVTLGVSSHVKRRQGIALSLVMLGMMGLFLSCADNACTTLRLLGIEQCLLSLILCRRWQLTEVLHRHDRWFQIVLATWLILSFSGWDMTLKDSLQTFGVVSRIVPALLSATLMYGITKMSFEETEMENSPSSKFDFRFDLAIVLVVIFSIRFPLWERGEYWFVIPNWESVAGTFLGAIVAIAVQRQRSDQSEVRQPLNVYQQLAESQFHTLSLWDGLMQIPAAILGGAINLYELWLDRSRQGVREQDESGEHATPFVWELALGGASLVVLSGLFLWMRG